jgi:choline dehydrogenase-like flavoprotein
MLFDFNEAWPRVSETRYDVCICGTGPAGITVARKLASYGKRVVLLEGGGLGYSDQSQDSYKGKSIGRPFWWIETARLRYFGGTSNHWGGLCAIFDPVSFESYDHNGLPGWPISHAQVVANLEEAQDILDIRGNYMGKMKEPHFDSPLFERYSRANSPPTRFAEKYGDELRNSRLIDVFYNANMTDIRLFDDLAGVKHVRVENYNGRKVELAADRYVIACGGLENPRVLLNANSQMPNGIGNRHDMVGRCFMESLNVPAGRFLVTNPEFWQRKGEIYLWSSEEVVHKNRTGVGVIAFSPNISDQIMKHAGRLRVFREFLHQTGCYAPAFRDLARKFVEFACPGDGIVHTMVEQEPNRKSRVSLSDDVDRFGLRRLQFNWEFSERDFRTIRTLVMEAAKEMARLNLARVQLSAAILDPRVEFGYVHGHSHHMGTTRMSSDPHHGVVDENCRSTEFATCMSPAPRPSQSAEAGIRP